MAATFVRIQSDAKDFQSQPLYITANFVLMTVVVSNAYLPDQDIQLWQKVYATNGNYALVCAHTVNGQQYCIISPSAQPLVLWAFDSSTLDDFAWFTDMGGMILTGGAAINIPGDTYYSGQQLTIFQEELGAGNEGWQFVT